MTSEEYQKHDRWWGVRTDVRDGTDFHSTESERETYIRSQNLYAPGRVESLIIKDAVLHNLALDFMRTAESLDAAARDMWFEMNERGIRECCHWPIAISHVLHTLTGIERSSQARARGAQRRRERDNQ